MTPVIEAAGLTKQFGETVALAEVGVVAEPGQVPALLGPNGAGKTTFVRAAATLLRTDGGQLLVAGYAIRRQLRAVRRVIRPAGQYAVVEPLGLIAPPNTQRNGIKEIALLARSSASSRRPR